MRMSTVLNGIGRMLHRHRSGCDMVPMMSLTWMMYKYGATDSPVIWMAGIIMLFIREDIERLFNFSPVLFPRILFAGNLKNFQ